MIYRLKTLYFANISWKIKLMKPKNSDSKKTQPTTGSTHWPTACLPCYGILAGETHSPECPKYVTPTK